jgi:hypothetical protein
MKELYTEDLASSGGPESCGGVREGVCEALTGVMRAGLLSREIFQFGVPTSFNWAEGEILGGVMRESLGDPTRSEKPGTYRVLHAREPGGPMIARPGVVGAGRAGKAEAVIP